MQSYNMQNIRTYATLHDTLLQSMQNIRTYATLHDTLLQSGPYK